MNLQYHICIAPLLITSRKAYMSIKFKSCLREVISELKRYMNIKILVNFVLKPLWDTKLICYIILYIR